VSASTFTPHEIEMLQKWGNAKAASRWLATWTENMYHKPNPNQPKKVKEFMRQKYIDKTYYWDPEENGPPPAPPTLITTRPSEKDLWKIEQEASKAAEELDHGQMPVSYSNGFPPAPPKWNGYTASSVLDSKDRDKKVNEDLKKEISPSLFADFASAFPIPSTTISLTTSTKPYQHLNKTSKSDESCKEKPAEQNVLGAEKNKKMKHVLELKPVQSYLQSAKGDFLKLNSNILTKLLNISR
jgi:hypothetical protein